MKEDFQALTANMKVMDCEKIYQQVGLNNLLFEQINSKLYHRVSKDFAIKIYFMNGKKSFSYLEDKKKYWNLLEFYLRLFNFGFSTHFMSDKNDPERISDILDSAPEMYELESDTMLEIVKETFDGSEYFIGLMELIKILDKKLLQQVKIWTLIDPKIIENKSSEFHCNSDEFSNSCHILFVAGYNFREILCWHVDKANIIK